MTTQTQAWKRDNNMIGRVLGNRALNDRIRQHCRAAGYSDTEIEAGLLYANHTGYRSDG